MQNIIVASDLSERSSPALARGIRLAAESGARLTVVHVVDDTLPPDLEKQLSLGAEAMLSEQVAEEVAGREIKTQIKVIAGDVFEVVEKVINQTNGDLLVVGPHRRRKFFDQIRETTMEHLVRASTAPVLLAVDAGQADYREVLCGVDLSEVCAAALHKIAAVAPNGALTLFHAHEVSFRAEAERDYNTWQSMHPLPEGLPEPVFMEGKVTDVLQALMDAKTYDLLAIGAHTRSSAGRYMLGSFSAGLIRRPPCDLLLAK